ncbi:2-dehydropantoate 2-reductase [Agrobacterium larrymoorei]|uniref:2-dehydropantoate 2-reductase n=1 Tax=Agrobacterium larrymoorei TaxID=160699 RepID=A0AAJ2EQ86_9HYPH|nr:2-dehydropantoate 2-reductase [Agrobacterium larrymoorei]MDR6100945.1 2-dehydropantoate 2-reductase [Agrobacterium larrymoorei]
MTRPLSIAIHGAGAVGSALAARLMAADLPPEVSVTLIARGTRLGQLRKNGLSLTDLTGRIDVFPAAVAERAIRPVDILFLCVKGHAIADALTEDLPYVTAETVVIPLVNGIPWWYFADTAQPRAVSAVDPDGRLLSMLDSRQILGCVVYMTAELDAEGMVTAHSPHQLVIGPATGPITDTHKRVATLLECAGVKTTLTPTIRETIWQKLTLNLATNPLSALTGASVAQISQDPALMSVARAIADEVKATAHAWGAEVPGYEEFRTRLRLAGDFPTSMLQDARAGRPLETGSICQAPLDLAAEAGVAMPLTRNIVHLLRHVAPGCHSSQTLGEPHERPLSRIA